MINEVGDMITHINALKTLGEQLSAIGADVKEDDMVITLLEVFHKSLLKLP